MGICVVLVVVILAYFSPQLIAVNDESILSNARYACGIRKRFGVELFHEDHKAELGQWPWHAALFYRNEYICGGTLIDQKHVLTAAHCVFEIVKSNSTHLFRVYLGLQFLNEKNYAQKKTVREVHLRFGHNGIALLELSDIVQYSELVIPICLVGSQMAKVEDLMGKRGWVPGWGRTKTDEIESELKMAQMRVSYNTLCITQENIRPFVPPTKLCARPINGTSICTGYGGGGMYFLAGDHWELRGIVPFFRSRCETLNMAFTNVPFYFEWIKGLTKGTLTREDIAPKRLSEQKCQEYQKVAKNINVICLNANSPHTVAIIDRSQRLISSGSIISEKFVLTKAPNLVDIFELDVEWNDLKVRVFQQLDKDILRNYLHPHYNTETHRHHVMLLELKTPFIFTSGLLPACLANDETENLNDILLLNGYTDLNSNVYERNDSKVIKSEICNSSVQSINWKYSINVEEFCTIFKTDESPSRSGIVGGALQTLNTRSCMYTIVGITKQLLHDNIEYKYINVFSRVVNYLDWIEEVVWGKEVIEA